MQGSGYNKARKKQFTNMKSNGSQAINSNKKKTRYKQRSCKTIIILACTPTLEPHGQKKPSKIKYLSRKQLGLEIPLKRQKKGKALCKYHRSKSLKNVRRRRRSGVSQASEGWDLFVGMLLAAGPGPIDWRGGGLFKRPPTITYREPFDRIPDRKLAYKLQERGKGQPSGGGTSGQEEAEAEPGPEDEGMDESEDGDGDGDGDGDIYSDEGMEGQAAENNKKYQVTSSQFSKTKVSSNIFSFH